MDLTGRYLQLLSFALVAFIISLLITPWVGKLAERIGAVDLPPDKRGKLDKTSTRRVHQHSPALLGGLAMMVGLVGSILLLGEGAKYPWGLWAGLAVVVIYGFLDDWLDLNALHMLFFQTLAAALVVISGITVTSIQIAGVFVSFQSSVLPTFIPGYELIFPADLLTILWIVGLMNVMNWVGGIDGLNGAVSAIISTAMLLISMKLGLFLPAVFLAAHVGAVVGVLPYNYHLSKIFYGSIGDFGNGFILAVMSILAGTKLPLFLVIMGLPFFDALVVLFGRLKRNKSYILRPWKILSINDKTHFHHKLLDLGLGHKGVMFIEAAITTALAALALLINDFRSEFVILILTGALILMVIAFMGLLARRIRERREIMSQLRLQKNPSVKIDTIDERAENKKHYRY